MTEKDRSSQPERSAFYESPFAFRYGSPEMRRVWSEENRWSKVRQTWIAVAETQHSVGLVSAEELQDLRQHQRDLNVGRIFEIEKENGHDVAAAIAEFGEKAKIGERIIHQGMTSEDVLSNAEALRIHEGLNIIDKKLDAALLSFADKIESTKDIVCMGWTHLQAAEPTTVGYRLGRYAQDLLIDKDLLSFVKGQVKGKGIKGAVGTSASFTHLLEGTGMSAQEQEKQVMEKLGIDPVLISGQAYPRKLDMLTVMSLASIGQSLHRFGLDVQILQSSPFAEWAEPRRKKQIGSSAMPHKQNPINTENIDSLTAGFVGKLPESWLIAATETQERTLRDSAGKRAWLPESFLIVDEALIRTEKVAKGLMIHEEVIDRNLNQYGPFSALKVVLAESSNRGANRQVMHETLRELASDAQSAVWNGEKNPLEALTKNDPRVTNYITETELTHLFENVRTHIGDAPERAQQLVDKIKNRITS